MFVDGIIGEGAFYEFPGEVQSLIMDNACEFKAETASPDFWTNFTCEDATQITVPTLLLTGKKSLKMFQLIVDVLHRCLPNSEHAQVPNSTHEMPADNPEMYNKIILEFLAKQPDGPYGFVSTDSTDLLPCHLIRIATAYIRTYVVHLLRDLIVARVERSKFRCRHHNGIITRSKVMQFFLDKASLPCRRDCYCHT